ncbi:MAG: methyltransferase [Alphaproteobacteria bacterium]|nr:methyltransferase [Alphaproteobacteria bacterium]
MAALPFLPARSPPSGPRSAHERFVTLRNRLLLNPRFHAWAARFPLTRGLVARRAHALFDVIVGFVYAKVAAACVELGLLDVLARGAATRAALAQAIGLAPAQADALFKAAAALDLVQPLGPERLALGMQGAALLGTPGVRDIVLHHALLYADMADPVAFLKRSGPGRLGAYWSYAANPEPQHVTGDAADAYSTLMARSQPMVAAQAVAAYPFRRARAILDVGGGEGAFLTAIAPAAPDARLMLFDLPAVAARARLRLDAAGLGARVDIHAGDFHGGGLPRGADLVTLVRVLHDHDDAPAAALLRAVREALPPGGRVAVIEQMGGRSAVSDAFFNLYLLGMGAGRARTPDEIARMLRAAGFTRTRRIATPTPLIAEIVEGVAGA